MIENHTGKLVIAGLALFPLLAATAWEPRVGYVAALYAGALMWPLGLWYKEFLQS